MRKILLLLVVMGLAVGTASAQFGGIVYDPTNYANAVLRYGQLVQQLAQLKQTYQQILTQYNLALAMSQNLRNMPARYRAQFSQWRNGAALNTYGNTGGWIAGINTGNVGGGYQQATTPLGRYQQDHLASMDAVELSRVQSQYASVELTDGANSTAMASIGTIRGNAQNLETQLRNLENDSLSGDADLNTEVSVLNKINADVVKILATQDMKERLAGLGVTPEGGSRAQFTAFVRSEIAKWGKLIKDANIKAD